MLEELISFFLFAFSATFTPGPNNILMLNSGLHFGTKKSLPHLIGISLGFPLMLLIVALGFGAILTQHVWLHHVFKIAGSFYLVYLAFQILKSSSNINTKTKTPLKPMTFFQAVLFQWVNPKAWMIAISIISIFTFAQNYIMNAFLLSAIMVIICFICIFPWLFFGTFLKKCLKNEKHMKYFNISMATLLLASVALIFI